MQTLKLFIASSQELKEDRDALREYLSTLNDHFREFNKVYFELVQWEFFLDQVSKTRLQDEYNQALLECDVVVSLFYTKAGMYTKEEFQTAYKSFQENDKPRLFTFFRRRKKGQQVEDSVLEFEAHLKEINHFPTFYENEHHLCLQIGRQLNLILQEMQEDFEEEQAATLIKQQAEKYYVYNQYLTRKLIDCMVPYCIPAKNLSEGLERANIQDWEKNQDVLTSAQLIISYSFVGEIGVQLSHLVAIGKDKKMGAEKPNTYIDKCIDIAYFTIELVNFALISRLWDRQISEDKLSLSDDQNKIIKDRLSRPFLFTLKDQFKLLETLNEIFQAHPIEFPLKDLSEEAFQEAMNHPEEEGLAATCMSLQELKDLPAPDRNIEKCAEAEFLLGRFLSFFSFLSAYNMASIKRIGFTQIRHSEPFFLHQFTALGLDSKNNQNSEKVVYVKETSHTDAVLLYKTVHYEESINLFPFVIDINALTYETGAKVCFYHFQDPSGQHLNYLWLERDEVMPIEHRKTLEVHKDLTSLMMDNLKRRDLNLDQVVEGIEEARKAFMTPAEIAIANINNP